MISDIFNRSQRSRLKINPKDFRHGLGFFFAYAVLDSECLRDEAWKIFRKLLIFAGDTISM
jgi:hypothetical protein